MDENVAKAVGEVDLRFTSGNAVPVERASVRDHEWQTIRARLVELEAENERLNAAWDSSFKQAMQNGESAQVHRDRAERAEALLRECVENREGLAYQTDLLARITAHLGGENNG